MKTVQIPLNDAITIGEKPVDTITLRKPHAGELRGLKLTQLLEMDVVAWEKLLPRITDPVIDAAAMAQIDVEDLTELISEGVGFFVGSKDRSPAT